MDNSVVLTSPERNLMSKPRTLFVVSLVSVLWIFSADTWAEDRPNIVFFFADDQTTSTLGCYGNDIVQTPTIDALAARGLRFDNMCVSHSICWVSRTTILTGLIGRSYGTPSDPEKTRPEIAEKLVSDLLREAGYRTGYFGKWHAKMPKGYQPSDHFDELEIIGRNPFYKKMPDGSLRHETEVIVDRGIEFLNRQPGDKPFFLNMWFNACHAEDSDRRPGIGHFPWPRAVDGMYEDLQMPEPLLGDPIVFDALPDFMRTTINRERFFWRWNTPLKYQTNMRAYYRMVSGIDQAMGRFLGVLEERGMLENTIVVYSADNGYHMGNRGLAGKWSHFEEALRVPLIIADPRHKSKAGATELSALNVDLPATFLDWANVDIPSRYQGKSLRSLVEGTRPKDWRSETFHEHFAVRNRIPAFEGLRNAKFKYVRYFDHDNHEFLHDLKKDPLELVNLARDPTHKEVLEQMRARTTERVKELGGPLDPPGKEFQHSSAPHPASAAANRSADPPTSFAKIFNGRNLQGWSGDPKYWSIKDGAITGATDGKLDANRFITWKQSTIRNFDLRMKIKIDKVGNSGIQYRATSRPEFGLDILSGYQCDVVGNKPEYDGMLYEERERRILGRAGKKIVIDPDGQPWIVGKLPSVEIEHGQWHNYRVLARGNHLQHWIDGQMTIDVMDFEVEERSLEGVLGMQVHKGPPMQVQFKDIQIQHLADDLPLKEFQPDAIPPGSLGVRPQGKLPKNWQPPTYTPAASPRP